MGPFLTWPPHIWILPFPPQTILSKTCSLIYPIVAEPEVPAISGPVTSYSANKIATYTQRESEIERERLTRVVFRFAFKIL